MLTDSGVKVGGGGGREGEGFVGQIIGGVSGEFGGNTSTKVQSSKCPPTTTPPGHQIDRSIIGPHPQANHDL